MVKNYCYLLSTTVTQFFLHCNAFCKSLADKILLQRRTREDITRRLIPLYNYKQQSFLFRKLTDMLSYVLTDPRIFFRNFL
jgi:hypothetical protein